MTSSLLKQVREGERQQVCASLLRILLQNRGRVAVSVWRKLRGVLSRKMSHGFMCQWEWFERVRLKLNLRRNC